MSETKKLHTLTLIDGTYKTELNKMYMSRKKWAPENPNEILSFMPGMVVEYKVKVGDKVKIGDTLLLFKAMKMNNNILSPVDGTVKKINVKAGENVPKNAVLMELE